MYLDRYPSGIICFYPYPYNTLDLSRSQARQYFQQAPQSSVEFHWKLTRPATNALSPINVVTTRGAGITAAAGTRLTHHLFVEWFRLHKSLLKKEKTL